MRSYVGVVTLEGLRSRPCGAPASSFEVGPAVLGRHDGSFDVFIPDAGRPVTHRQQVLWESRAADNRVDRTMVS